MSESTRRIERLEIIGELNGEVMVYQPMAVKVLSPFGALIQTAFPLQVDSLHDLRLRLGEVPIVVKARIVHSHISEVEDQGVSYAVGVEFVEPSEHVVDAIKTFVQALAERQA